MAGITIGYAVKVRSTQSGPLVEPSAQLQAYEDWRDQYAADQPTGQIPFPGSAPDAWDTVVLAGIALPGIATVAGFMEQRVHKKQSPKKHGQTVTFLGWAAAPVDVKLQVWTPDQWDALLVVMKKILVPLPKKGIPPPVSIAHPSLTSLGISSVYVMKVGAPRPMKGIVQVELKCEQFLPDELRAAGSGTNKKTWDLTDQGPGALNHPAGAAAPTNPKPSTKAGLKGP